jgi:tyrosine-protein kinase Etk/Wzc
MKKTAGSAGNSGYSPADYPVTDGTITLADILLVFVKRRWFIIGTTFVAAVLVLLFSILTLVIPPDSPFNLMPNYYRPQVVVLIQESGTSMISALASSSGALSKFLGGAAPVNPNVALAKKLLTGITMKDQIIEEFDFFTKYELEKSKFPQTAAREAFDVNSGFSFGDPASGTENIITISYEDIDPVFASRVADRLVEILAMRFKELSLEKVSTKKEFIGTRLGVVEGELQATQKEMEDFQLRYGVIDISSQAKEQAELMASLQAEVIKGELELQTLEEYLDTNNPRIVRIRQEIDKKSQLINELKTGFEQYSGGVIPQNMIPELTTKYLSIRAEIAVQEKIYSMLRQEYELARIEETDTTKTFQIIEPVEVPEMKAGPYRSKICIITTLVAFFLACITAFVIEYFAKAQQDPEEAAKINAMKEMLRLRKPKEKQKSIS